MIFALVGGDERAVFLGEKLLKTGSEVKYSALEKAVCCCDTLEECVNGAQCVILGVPSVRNGFVNAPLSGVKLAPEEVYSLLTPAQTLCGGFGKSGICTDAAVFDLLSSESFALGNAALTAEGAIAILTESSAGALRGSKLLILGAGRVASALRQRLNAFETSVTVGARADGTLEKALSELGEFDYIVNTVPARIIGKEALENVKRGAVIMELASAPGGFDRESAEKAGLCVINAPGLPGRFSPRASAELMEKEILAYMEAYHGE